MNHYFNTIVWGKQLNSTSLVSLPYTGECDWRCHLPGTPHRHVWLPGSGDPTARAPEDWWSEGCGFSLHWGRDGHCHVCRKGVTEYKYTDAAFRITILVLKGTFRMLYYTTCFSSGGY